MERSRVVCSCGAQERSGSAPDEGEGGGYLEYGVPWRLEERFARMRAKEDDDNNTGTTDDAKSGFVNLDRVEEVTPSPPPPLRPCWTCRVRPSSIVLLLCHPRCSMERRSGGGVEKATPAR